MESIVDEAEKKSKVVLEKPLSIKKAADLQRLKLEKLMKNIDKPIIIPERRKEKNITNVPEFVRNVMGSSAGAGSGEFHVYRHLRRKEYARQKFIQIKSEKEKLDEAYKMRLEENARLAEERTAKKRAKRLKKKEKMKNKKKIKTGNETQKAEENESSESGSEESEKEDKDFNKHEDVNKKDDKNSDNPENESGSKSNDDSN